MPAHGDLKIFYGWKADTKGSGAGSLAMEGGFFLDPAISDESYPDKEYAITGLNQAVAECLSAIRFMQRHQDAGGTVSYRIFGSPSDNPMRAIAGTPGNGAAVVLMRVDVPEREVYRAVNFANRPKDPNTDTNLTFGGQESGSGA